MCEHTQAQTHAAENAPTKPAMGRRSPAAACARAAAWRASAAASRGCWRCLGAARLRLADFCFGSSAPLTDHLVGGLPPLGAAALASPLFSLVGLVVEMD